MPFLSRAQMRYMFARHPDIARRWVKTYGIPKNLPEHVRKRKAAIMREAIARRRRKIARAR